MFRRRPKKILGLIILDGWGIAPAWGGNAIYQANTKVFNRIRNEYPSTTLLASGDAVGLPTNSPGNSEAGHINLGAGHVVHQDVSLIDAKIEDNSFYNNEKLHEAIEHATRYRSNIHIMGLLSKTGTHSHIRHLFAILQLLKTKNFNRVYIHLFSDGRDSDPMSGLETAEEVQRKIKEIGVGQVVSLVGRFYAMDRDNRWARVARAYDLLVKGEGTIRPTLRDAFSSSYSQGITDEFIEPQLIANKKQNFSHIEDNDTIIVFNFRGDRVRELAKAFLEESLPQIPGRVKRKNLYFASFVIYDDYPLSEKVFTPETIKEPLGLVWSKQGLKQFHIAETEKYPHVTYFINGGIEKPFPGEKRIMIPSPRDVKTYDLVPKMSAEAVTDSLLKAVKSNVFDSFIINYANTDMVGHTGNLSATIQAVEFVDICLGKLLAAVLERGGTACIVADHGNAEQMVNPQTGEPDTEHTTNPVPFSIISDNAALKNLKLENDGILANVTPTMLDIMGIAKSATMVNPSIIIKEGIASNVKRA